MDFFGLESKRKIECYKRAIETEPRAKAKFDAYMALENIKRLFFAAVATYIFKVAITGQL